MIESWEACFGLSFMDALTEDKRKTFWCLNTPLSQCLVMLLDAVATHVISEAPTSKGPYFKVMRKKDNHIYADEFNTLQAANAHKKEIALHSPLTVNELVVIQVHE